MAKERTYYTKKDLISFGNFVLSPLRRKNLILIRREQGKSETDPTLDQVYESDLANWRDEVQEHKAS